MVLSRLKDWGIASSINFKSLLLLPVITISLIAQNFEREIDPFPVSNSSGELINVFSGGTNNPEFQFVDIDADSDADLFILNRDATVHYYENIGSRQSARFQFIAENFPGLKIVDWFYFVDIDSDDDYDLFTAKKPNYISLLENVGSPENPFFETLIDTLKDTDGNYIFSEGISNPIFIDIDADGDHDFISGSQSGKVTFYENTGTPQSFDYKFVTDFWQEILIIGGGLAKSSRHGANSIEFGDIDNDNDFDLFWGDFFSSSLYYFENTGTPQNAQLELVAEIYPRNPDSLITRGYNMPRLFDIDADGDLDLFASVLFDAAAPETMIFYENIGTPENSDLRFVTIDYIKTLDVGTKSAPSFIDIDSDGDLDMFIGNEQSPKGSIFFYENVGTRLKPSFQLVTKKFGNIDHDLSVAQTFGDIDGDGDYDVLVGELLGQISLYVNSGSATTPSFSAGERLKDESGNEIKYNNFARPFLVDIDLDNDLDLVLGSSNGELILYRNTGSAASFQFSVDENYFAGIDVGEKSAPALVDYDNDGDYDLFIGNRDGNIHHFLNNGGNESPIFQLVTDKFLEPNFGAESIPFFADIDSDSDLDLFIGNFNGGLFFFNNLFVTDVTVKSEINNKDIRIYCYPNPFNNRLSIQLELSETQQISIRIFNILGQLVKEIDNMEFSKGKHMVRWSGINSHNNYVNSGIYIVNISSELFSKSFPVQLIK